MSVIKTLLCAAAVGSLLLISSAVRAGQGAPFAETRTWGHHTQFNAIGSP